MLALLIAAVSGPPATPCNAADPAVTDVHSQLIKKRGAPDHYVISATIANVGSRGQTPQLSQRVTLLRDGVILAPQPIPPLGAGVSYRFAFAVDRPAAERSRPLRLTLRYQLLSGDSADNACNRTNDEITQSF